MWRDERQDAVAVRRKPAIYSGAHGWGIVPIAISLASAGSQLPYERGDMEEPIRVLVVDDEVSDVEAIRAGLEADGMRVFSAGDGAEALDVLRHEDVDVIILDIMMPRVDGWMALMETLDEIVYISAKNKSTYVHTYENQFLVDLTLTELEQRLAKESFERVHRSYMINLNHIKEILRAEGAYIVVVTDRDETQVPVARRHVRGFREAVGL